MQSLALLRQHRYRTSAAAARWRSFVWWRSWRP